MYGEAEDISKSSIGGSDVCGYMLNAVSISSRSIVITGDKMSLLFPILDNTSSVYNRRSSSLSYVESECNGDSVQVGSFVSYDCSIVLQVGEESVDHSSTIGTSSMGTSMSLEER